MSTGVDGRYFSGDVGGKLATLRDGLGSMFDTQGLIADRFDSCLVASESFRPALDNFRISTVDSLMAAIEPVSSISDWFGTDSLSVATGFDSVGSSLVEQMADSFDRLGLTATGSLGAQLSSISESFAESVNTPVAMLSNSIPGADLKLTNYEVPLAVNPLLEPMLDLAETNLQMHRRLEEMTVSNREIRDEVMSLREWQAESDKGAQRWTRREIGIAFLGLLVAVATIVQQTLM